MDAIKGLFHSKKFYVMLAGIAVVILNKALGLELSAEEIQLIVGMNVMALLGYGFADFGKEGKKELAAAAKTMEPVPNPTEPK